MSTSRYQAWTGRDEPPTTLERLVAGPVTTFLDEGDLRYAEVAGTEIVRRLYVAVRNPLWGTIPSVISGREIERSDDGFRASFSMHHQAEDIDFLWRGTIEGEANGSLSYEMKGTALGDFEYAKIGICLLHPLSTSVGRRYHGRGVLGEVNGCLPATIAPQVMIDEIEQPLFPAVSSLEIEVSDELSVVFEFSGDLFEMEDQRNWTDASFKTYSTPAHLGSKLQARAGKELCQRVRVSVRGPKRRKPGSHKAPALTADTGDHSTALPSLGLSLSSEQAAPSATQVALLRELRLDHLRADLLLSAAGWEERLVAGAQAAESLGCGVELALVLDELGTERLGRLASRLRELRVPLARVIVLHEQEEVTDPRWVAAVRDALSAQQTAAEFAGGTNIYFNELNRHRRGIEGLDAVAYPVTPQLHAFDERSIAETFEGQAATVATARTFCGPLPLVVSPITLRPRFNAHAVEASVPQAPVAESIDPRQSSMFASGWLLGTVATLTRCAVESMTFFETAGRRGVMELHEPAARAPIGVGGWGAVFPTYHILADLGELKFDEAITLASTEPRTVVGLAFQGAGGRTLLAANLTENAVEVDIESLRFERARVRLLTDENVGQAVTQVREFRTATWTSLERGGSVRRSGLPPFALARIEEKR